MLPVWSEIYFPVPTVSQYEPLNIVGPGFIVGITFKHIANPIGEVKKKTEAVLYIIGGSLHGAELERRGYGDTRCFFRNLKMGKKTDSRHFP